MRRLKPQLGGAAVGLLAGLLIGLLLVTNSLATRNCHQIELLKATIRAQVQGSASRLGQKGTAGYAYYHAHPAELAVSRRETLDTLHAFHPAKCG